MFGFQIVMGGGKILADIEYNDLRCRNYMIDKFQDDKIFKEDDDFITLLDGVILNKKSLLKQYNNDNWCSLVSSLYIKNGDAFFKEFRGSFAGALYDKKKDKLIIYGDQLGSKFIYYSHIGDFFCCSQVMGGMYDLLKENGKEYHLDTTAAKIMLTYGFMIEDYTLCKEVRKIEPGCYLVYENNEVSIHRYYMLDNTTNNSITEQDAIERIDKLFRQAVTREYEKDKEYGYKHICALSGGLDCRMTTFVAHDLGYTRQLNCTFSQSDYLDQTIPQKMASDLKHEWLFKALDNGMWLYDADEVTKITGGNVLYYGTAHGNSLYKYVNFKNLGIFHSGQLGDVTISTHCIDSSIPYSIGDGGYSQKFMNKLKLQLKKNYNKELGLYYYRYLNGTNNGIQNIYNYTETISPFMDLDFLEYALSIPSELRYNHHLYHKWILHKYPQAAKYVWESTGCRVDTKMVHIGKWEKPLERVPYLIMSRLGLKKDKSSNSLNHMNPIAYYLTHNKELLAYLNNYFEYAETIPDIELKTQLTLIDKSGTPMERIQAVTLLAAVKAYYG